MGDRLEIVDGVDAVEAETLGELVAIEPPVAIGELDLAAGDRPRHRQHGRARRHAGRVEIAADRGLGTGHRLVVDDRHPLRTAGRRTHRETGRTAADVGEENAAHTNTPTPTLLISAKGGNGSACPCHGRACPGLSRLSHVLSWCKAWMMPAFAGMTESLFISWSAPRLPPASRAAARWW